MADHYFSERPERTHAESFHAAARLARDAEELGADGAEATRNTEHVFTTDDSAPPVKLSTVYGLDGPDRLVDLLEASQYVEEVDVIERSRTISATIDARENL